MPKKYLTQQLQSLFYEELEPRLLFSADFEAALIHDPFQENNVLDYGVIEADLHSDSSFHISEVSEQAESKRQELVVVDSATPEYQHLLDGLLDHRDKNNLIDVVILNAEQNGITQLNNPRLEDEGFKRGRFEIDCHPQQVHPLEIQYTFE